jgi:uncharacterized protein YdeI (YjbR/CyaY-like superfamily)
MHKNTDLLEFTSREEFRCWLKMNHKQENGIWILFAKGNKQFSASDALEEAICFGWIDGMMYSLDSDKYILRMTPRMPGSMWSMINRKRAERLIADGRMTEAGMVPIREAQSSGRWQAAYSSKKEPNVPEDLITALQADPVANSNFENWSNSQKLQAVVWIEQSRQLKTRANRINKVVSCAHNEQKLF